MQVSSAQLGSLARLAAGQSINTSPGDGATSSGGGAEFNGAATSVADGTGRFGDLTLEEFRCAAPCQHPSCRHPMLPCQPGAAISMRTPCSGPSLPLYGWVCCESHAVRDVMTTKYFLDAEQRRVSALVFLRSFRQTVTCCWKERSERAAVCAGAQQRRHTMRWSCRTR